jgi:hypothetical protein
MSNDSTDRGLGDYLHRRLDYLQKCNAAIETKLSDDELSGNE